MSTHDGSHNSSCGSLAAMNLRKNIHNDSKIPKIKFKTLIFVSEIMSEGKVDKRWWEKP